LLGFGWNDFFGGVILAGVARTVINHHSTFLINSLSHYMGDQTYSDAHSSRDNWFTAFLTFGEGYHNFHHEFPSDYRNGVRFYHFDPTKWLIYGLSLVGMTKGLLRVRQEIIVRKRIAMREKKLSQKFAKQWSLPELKLPKRALVRIRRSMEAAGKHLSDLRTNYEDHKRKKSSDLRDISIQLDLARSEFRHKVNLWKLMSKRFTKLAYQYA
jgi:stearoyl-CoA desaturase (delta-9 desaturase)